MVDFTTYAQIKDNYCICYFGYSDEYLTQLDLLQPHFKKKYPGLNLHFGCRDDKSHLFNNQSVMKLSEIKLNKNKFAHISELKYNGVTHPIADLLTINDIKDYTITNAIKERITNRAIIITSGSYPTKPLTSHQINKIKFYLNEQGYEVFVDTDISNASYVIGVESVALFVAASKEIPTILVPTGVGASLYQKMFPKGEVRKF